MSLNKIGRNDPSLGGPATAAIEELEQAIGDREFGSTEALQAFLDSFQFQRNHRRFEDFRGLSPDQMRQLLHFPLESPDVLQVSTVLESEPDAPLAQLFGLLAEAIGGKGLKPTAKGNFPRNPCREIMQAWRRLINFPPAQSPE
ncbi:hypothetical protein [Spiribacter roseus]|uniref:hypothetical protein n=1 Tax=Spiribacter roseus TaxID=1855875 RepID=UPI001330F4C6|nr:hypothetical protein [Spiribacter roseus]KAF0282174.1 hypothetical protein BA900_01655 [Spiribacter roseus]